MYAHPEWPADCPVRLHIMADAETSTSSVDTYQTLCSIDFAYHPRDPFTVWLRWMHATCPSCRQPQCVTCADPVVWAVSREILDYAAYARVHAGRGDFQAWPHDTAGAYTMLLFAVGDDQSRCRIRAGTLRRFLKRTFALVPRGHETQHLDLDTLIGQILATTDN